MVENIYKNDNSDEVLKKIMDKLVGYDQSFEKIKSQLNRIKLFIKEDTFARDFKLLDEEISKVEKLWQLPLEIKVIERKNLFNKIIYFFKNIYFKILFFFLKPFKNRVIAGNLVFRKALEYLVDSHEKLISNTDKFCNMFGELLEEMNKSILGISEKQNHILKKTADSERKM